MIILLPGCLLAFNAFCNFRSVREESKSGHFFQFFNGHNSLIIVSIIIISIVKFISYGLELSVYFSCQSLEIIFGNCYFLLSMSVVYWIVWSVVVVGIAPVTTYSVSVALLHPLTASSKSAQIA